MTGKANMITDYNIYVSMDNKAYTKVASGTFKVDGFIKKVHFTPTVARYVRLEATATSGNQPAVINEIDLGSDNYDARPVRGEATQLMGEAARKGAMPVEFRRLATGEVEIQARGAFGHTVRGVDGAALETGKGLNSARAGRNLKMGV